MQAFIGPGLKAFERMHDDPATGRFCHGDRVGLADILPGGATLQRRPLGVSLGAMPRIRAIRAEPDAIPAVAAAHPDLAKP